MKFSRFALFPALVVLGTGLFSACSSPDRPDPIGALGGAPGDDRNETRDDERPSGDADASEDEEGETTEDESPKDGEDRNDSRVTPSQASCAGKVCSPFAECVGEAEMARCVCAEGLEGDGQRCIDVDECSADPKACGENALCVNRFSSHDCVCNDGYVRKNGDCVDVDECELALCSPDASCENTEGGVICACPGGSVGDGFFCRESDPCQDDPCNGAGTCLPSPAGHSCACEEGFWGRETCSPCGDALILSDPGLRTAVNLQLGRAFDEETPQPLDRLKGHHSLDASGFSIRNLSGLECWSGLRELDLSDNPLLDDDSAAALATLTRLTTLDLSCTGVESATLLREHPSLVTLRVDVTECGARWDDLGPLSSMAKLESLTLTGHETTNVSVLELPRLRALFLSSNGLQSVAELPELPLLRELHLSHNELEDLNGVSRFSGLRFLNVAENEIDDLEPALALRQLDSLNASGNRVASIPEASSSSSLRSLVLSSNRLDSLRSLNTWSHLGEAVLADNEIESLKPILKGTFRGRLIVTGNPVSCKREALHIDQLRSRGQEIFHSCD